MKKRRQYYQPVDFKRLIKVLFKTARRQPVNTVIIRLTFRNFTLYIPITRDETTSVLNFCKFILEWYFIRVCTQLRKIFSITSVYNDFSLS